MITVMAMATSTRRGASKPANPPAGAKRIVWLVALALVASLILRDSLAYIIRPVDPGLALRIDPGNAEVAASRAEQLLRENPAYRAEAEALARRALRRSPVSAAGARMIATARDLAGDPAAARRLMAYSESLSQRDLPTQLWLIQDAVQRNDVAQALHHYDVALRSSDVSKVILFPVLVRALNQPAVVAGLVDTIVRRPAWAVGFLDQASRDAQDMAGLAALIGGLGRRGYAVPDAVLAEASARMADAGRFDAAWHVHAAGDPHAARVMIEDPDFTRIGEATGPFGWTAIPGNGLSIEPRQYGAQNALAYRAATGASGTVARQLLMLPAGGFRLSGMAPDRAEGSPPAMVRLTCAGSGVPLASVAANRTVFAGSFVVPSGCAAQWLEIVIDGGDNPTGTTGAIGRLQIAPEAGR